MVCWIRTFWKNRQPLPQYITLSGIIKTAERRMAEDKIMHRHIINYTKTRDTYVAYRKAGYSEITHFHISRNGQFRACIAEAAVKVIITYPKHSLSARHRFIVLNRNEYYKHIFLASVLRWHPDVRNNRYILAKASEVPWKTIKAQMGSAELNWVNWALMEDTLHQGNAVEIRKVEIT